MIAYLFYDLVFMALYMGVSYILCIHGKYKLNITLIEEIARGIQSLSFQLPLSNLATIHYGKFNEKEGLHIVSCLMYLFLFDMITFWIHYGFHSIPFLYRLCHKNQHEP